MKIKYFSTSNNKNEATLLVCRGEENKTTRIFNRRIFLRVKISRSTVLHILRIHHVVYIPTPGLFCLVPGVSCSFPEAACWLCSDDACGDTCSSEASCEGCCDVSTWLGTVLCTYYREQAQRVCSYCQSADLTLCLVS